VTGTVHSPAVFRISGHVVGFYFGRGLSGPSPLAGVEGNWVDAGSWSLGGIDYVVYKGDEAIVYDTSTLPETGAWVRDYLEQKLGIRRFTVVLSHWHLDHVAGLPAFADCPIYAPKLTRQSLVELRDEVEGGRLWGPPPIEVVLPTETFDGALDLSLGGLDVRFRQYAIHSRDQAVMIVPFDRTLYAGDALEDTVTYIVEPDELPTHIEELARLHELDVTRIYPNHGNPDVLRHGGYGKSLIDAVAEYDRNMLLHAQQPDFLKRPLTAFIPKALAAHAVSVWPPYRAVHQHNLELVHDYWQSRPLPELSGEHPHR
jgi:cyclase